jgi:G:T-mismatch repair DNA endonuclease (very short patch repair protein)
MGSSNYKIYDFSTLSPYPVLSWEETRRILAQFVNSNNKLNTQLIRDYFVKKHNLEDFFRSVLFYTPWVEQSNIGQKLYCVKHGLRTIPRCLVCNHEIPNYIKRNQNIPSPKYCSSKCAGTVNYPAATMNPEDYEKVKAKISVRVKGKCKSDGHKKALSIAQAKETTKEQRKATNLEKYGVENCGVLGGRYSKISQQLFWRLYKQLTPELQAKSYFFELNGEYYRSASGRCYAYDFVISSLKFCIEFNGDTWHANPKNYLAEDTPYPITSNITAKEIWDYDKIKLDILRNEGFTVHVVWESDFRGNSDLSFIQCINLINHLIGNPQQEIRTITYEDIEW